MANIEKIVLPDNTEYDIKDAKALQVINDGAGVCTSDGWQRLRAKSDDTVSPRFELYGSDGNSIGVFGSSGYSGGDLQIYNNYNGTQQGGMYAEHGGRTLVFSNGTGVYIRPNGSGSTSGQVYVDTSGQLHGGHPITQKSLQSGVSITANTVKNLLSFTELSTSAVYIVCGQLRFAPTSSTGAFIHLSMNTATNALGVWTQTSYSNSTATKYLHIMSVYSSVSSIYLNMQSGVAGTAETGTTFKIVQLA